MTTKTTTQAISPEVARFIDADGRVHHTHTGFDGLFASASPFLRETKTQIIVGTPEHPIRFRKDDLREITSSTRHWETLTTPEVAAALDVDREARNAVTHALNVLAEDAKKGRGNDVLASDLTAVTDARTAAAAAAEALAAAEKAVPFDALTH